MRFRTSLLRPHPALVGLVLAACGGTNSGDPAASGNEQSGTEQSGTEQPGSEQPGPEATGDPGPGAYSADFQTSDEFFTKMSTPVLSTVHANVRIWYSSNIMGLDPAGPFTVPEGTVAIKPEADDNGNVFVTVVMIKKAAGFDPDHHDWYYEARNPDDSLASSPTPGPAQICIDCHQDGASTDYFLGFSLEN